MPKQASFPIKTVCFLVEGLAFFAFILFILRFFADHLCRSMSELTFRPISTEAKLDPVFAHLCFVLSLVYFIVTSLDVRLLFASCRKSSASFLDWSVGGLRWDHETSIVGIQRLPILVGFGSLSISDLVVLVSHQW